MFCCACEGTCCHTGPHTFCTEHSGSPTPPPMVIASPPPVTIWTIYVPPTSEEIERLRGWVRWVTEVKNDDCRYDHHGLCQSHNLSEAPCPVAEMKAYLVKLTPDGGGDDGD